MTALVIAVVILSRANNESRTKTERIKQAFAKARSKAREQKIPLTVKCPAWLTVTREGDAKKFVVDEARARIVQRIFELNAGGMGNQRIASLLNTENIPTFMQRRQWAWGWFLTSSETSRRSASTIPISRSGTAAGERGFLTRKAQSQTTFQRSLAKSYLNKRKGQGNAAKLITSRRRIGRVQILSRDWGAVGRAAGPCFL
jgi:hypothetical protein